MRTRTKILFVPVIGVFGTVLSFEGGYSLMQIAVLFGLWSGLAGIVVSLSLLRSILRKSRSARVATWAVLATLVGGAAAGRSSLAGQGPDVVVGVFVLFAGGAAVFLSGLLLGKEHASYESRFKGEDDADAIDLPEPTDVANWPTPASNGRSLESIRRMEHR